MTLEYTETMMSFSYSILKQSTFNAKNTIFYKSITSPHVIQARINTMCRPYNYNS